MAHLWRKENKKKYNMVHLKKVQHGPPEKKYNMVHLVHMVHLGRVRSRL